MGYFPKFYDQINVESGTYFPSQVKSYNNLAFIFWERALFQRACSVLNITMPTIWEKNRDLLYFILFKNGFCCAGPDNSFKIGKWFNPCHLDGFDFYYRPVRAIVSNPYIKTLTGQQDAINLEIGKDCEIIKLTPDYMGIWDIITYYAEKLAVMDPAINMAIINSKFAYIIGSKNKAAAEVMKKLFDNINAGVPAVFFDKKLSNDGIDKDEPWQFLNRPVKESYIVTDLLRDFQTILNNFDTEIGIPTIPYQKKERMVTSEAESKQIDSVSRSLVWYETLNKSFDIVNKFLNFPSDDCLKVEMRFNPEGGVYNGSGEDNIIRNV